MRKRYEGGVNGKRLHQHVLDSKVDRLQIPPPPHLPPPPPILFPTHMVHGLDVAQSTPHRAVALEAAAKADLRWCLWWWGEGIRLAGWRKRQPAQQ